MQNESKQKEGRFPSAILSGVYSNLCFLFAFIHLCARFSFRYICLSASLPNFFLAHPCLPSPLGIFVRSEGQFKWSEDIHRLCSLARLLGSYDLSDHNSLHSHFRNLIVTFFICFVYFNDSTELFIIKMECKAIIQIELFLF